MKYVAAYLAGVVTSFLCILVPWFLVGIVFQTYAFVGYVWGLYDTLINVFHDRGWESFKVCGAMSTTIGLLATGPFCVWRTWELEKVR